MRVKECRRLFARNGAHSKQRTVSTLDDRPVSDGARSGRCLGAAKWVTGECGFFRKVPGFKEHSRISVRLAGV